MATTLFNENRFLLPVYHCAAFSPWFNKVSEANPRPLNQFVCISEIRGKEVSEANQRPPKTIRVNSRLFADTI
jgi:hypothetical protein